MILCDKMGLYGDGTAHTGLLRAKLADCNNRFMVACFKAHLTAFWHTLGAEQSRAEQKYRPLGLQHTANKGVLVESWSKQGSLTTLRLAQQ